MQLQQHSRLSGIGQPNATRYASPKLWPSSRPLHVPCSQAQPKQAGEAPSTNSRRTQLLGLIAIANLRTLGEVPGMAEATAAPAPGAIGEVANMIATDFAKGQYYVTGNLTESLYDDDCMFKDPTTNVKGAKKYTDAIKLLFDPAASKADLISLKVDSPTRVILRWRLEGTLKLGGGVRIKPYTGTTTYTVDASSGKIIEHSEVWDISTLDAFISPFLPSFGAPPAPPVDQIRADLIKNSFQKAGQPIPAGLGEAVRKAVEKEAVAGG